jgi:hypothetical protein
MRLYDIIKSILNIPIINTNDEVKVKQVKEKVIEVIASYNCPVRLMDITLIFFQKNILYRIYDRHIEEHNWVVHQAVQSLVNEGILKVDKSQKKLFDDGRELYYLQKDTKRDILLDQLLS